MQYNTQQKRMPLPEYGRSIQNMVDYALTIQDRAERQRCANTIINIMGNMFPHLRDVPDFKHNIPLPVCATATTATRWKC